MGWEDPPGKGKGYPLQYSGWENSMGCTVHWVTKSRTRLVTFTFTFPTLPFKAGEGLEKEGADVPAQDLWGAPASSLGRQADV